MKVNEMSVQYGSTPVIMSMFMCVLECDLYAKFWQVQYCLLNYMNCHPHSATDKHCSIAQY